VPHCGGAPCCKVVRKLYICGDISFRCCFQHREPSCRVLEDLSDLYPFEIVIGPLERAVLGCAAKIEAREGMDGCDKMLPPSPEETIDVITGFPGHCKYRLINNRKGKLGRGRLLVRCCPYPYFCGISGRIHLFVGIKRNIQPPRFKVHLQQPCALEEPATMHNNGRNMDVGGKIFSNRYLYNLHPAFQGNHALFVDPAPFNRQQQGCPFGRAPYDQPCGLSRLV